MSTMNTPKPAKQQLHARYELDALLSDIHLCVASLPPLRPDIKSTIERWFKGITKDVVEKPSATD